MDKYSKDYLIPIEKLNKMSEEDRWQYASRCCIFRDPQDKTICSVEKRKCLMKNCGTKKINKACEETKV